MSWLEHFRALARYNQLMNEKLYRLVGTLDDAERKRDRAAFFGSIHGTLNHLLLADRVWMLRFTGDHERYVSKDSAGQAIALTALNQVLYDDFHMLTRERSETDAGIVSFTLALDEETLERPFSYKSIGGAPQSHLLWWAVAHLFNHQTHHRGQVTTLLSQAGVDAGVTDLAAMFRDEQRFAAS
jgi:uncharacterized damage-inducible protein DinB